TRSDRDWSSDVCSSDLFEVWEGRRKLPLTGFEVLDLAAGAGSGPAGRPAGVPSVPAAARRHFLFLFDLAFSEPRSVVRARQAARSEERRVGKEWRVRRS